MTVQTTYQATELTVLASALPRKETEARASVQVAYFGKWRLVGTQKTVLRNLLEHATDSWVQGLERRSICLASFHPNRSKSCPVAVLPRMLVWRPSRLRQGAMLHMWEKQWGTKQAVGGAGRLPLHKAGYCSNGLEKRWAQEVQYLFAVIFNYEGEVPSLKHVSGIKLRWKMSQKSVPVKIITP